MHIVGGLIPHRDAQQLVRLVLGARIGAAAGLPEDVFEDFSRWRAWIGVRSRDSRVKGGKRNRFVLQVLLGTAQRYLFHLSAINKGIDQLEDRLQRTPRNREVLELLKYQKSLVYFTAALRSNELRSSK